MGIYNDVSEKEWLASEEYKKFLKEIVEAKSIPSTWVSVGVGDGVPVPVSSGITLPVSPPSPPQVHLSTFIDPVDKDLVIHIELSTPGFSHNDTARIKANDLMKMMGLDEVLAQMALKMADLHAEIQELRDQQELAMKLRSNGKEAVTDGDAW